MTKPFPSVWCKNTYSWIVWLVLLTALAVWPSAQSLAATSKGKTVRTAAVKVHPVAAKKAVKARVVKKRVSAKSVKAVKRRLSARAAPVAVKRPAIKAAVTPERLSFGQLAGLHETPDALNLKSSVAMVVDQQTNEVLYTKNEGAVLPIASLTKLMTGLVITQAALPLDEVLTITEEDVDTEKGSRSRLRVGSELTRGELLHLALMSSENRAAHALGRTYPGGMAQFVRQMNANARALQMLDTRYVEPTGLSSNNQSSARDLVKLVNAAHAQPLLRELSTSEGYTIDLGQRTLQFNNTNRLVKNPSWDIGLQKTGYISEAGRCLVMQASVAGRKLIMVFLDSAGKLSRLGDAERVRRWLETTGDALSVKMNPSVPGG